MVNGVFNFDGISPKVIQALNDYSFGEDFKDWCGGNEPLDKFFARIAEDERKWLDAYDEAADGDINEYVDLFWDNDGETYRKAMETKYLPVLAQQLAYRRQTKLSDVGIDADLMNICLTFKIPDNVHFSKIGNIVSEWIDGTGLYGIPGVEWKWANPYRKSQLPSDDDFEPYIIDLWIPWRKD